jgi:hypothetical protein
LLGFTDDGHLHFSHLVGVANPRASAEVRTWLLGICRYRSAPRCVEFGKGGLPIRIMRRANALQWFDPDCAPAEIFALHAGEPS